MYRNKRILALIPARHGSKELPGKNIRIFSGKPLLFWSIEAALGSRYIDKIVVSTDSKKIASISRKYGAQTPFIRPKRLATDQAKSIGVILHALGYFNKKRIKFDYIMLLQPTSPLRKAEDIDKSIRLLFEKKAKAIVSVCPVEHHPFWSNKIPKNGSLEKFLTKKAANRNRQGLPAYYRINGALYFSYVDFLKKEKGFIGRGTYAYVMPKERSVDIDTELDFYFAQCLKRKDHLKTTA